MKTDSVCRKISNEMILHEARSWIGTPYRHQASCKGAGCDCLGLVRGVYRAFWGEPEQPPAYSPDWAEASGEETLAQAAMRHLIQRDKGDLQAGHIVLFRWRAHCPAKHAAILVSENQMIHAQDGAAVTLASLSDWWKRRIAFVFSFPTHQPVQPNPKGKTS